MLNLTSLRIASQMTSANTSDAPAPSNQDILQVSVAVHGMFVNLHGQYQSAFQISRSTGGAGGPPILAGIPAERRLRHRGPQKIEAQLGYSTEKTLAAGPT